MNGWLYVSCLRPLKVHACCPGKTPQPSGLSVKTVVFFIVRC